MRCDAGTHRSARGNTETANGVDTQVPKKEEKCLTDKERLSPKLLIIRESFNEEHIISGNVRDHQVRSNVVSNQTHGNLRHSGNMAM